MQHPLIILAGGISSRMKNSKPAKGLSAAEVARANVTSKGLIPVGEAGRPLMDYLLLNAGKAGYQDVILLIGEQGNAFRELYGGEQVRSRLNGLNISFAVQYIPEGRSKPFGTADALFQTLEQYPEIQQGVFSVCNSDNLYSEAAFAALRQTESPNALINYDMDGLNFPAEKIARFAITAVTLENHVADIIEKPSVDEMETYRDANGIIRVSMNIFKFSGSMIYPYLKDCPVNPVRDEKELPTAMLNMIKDHLKAVLAIPMKEHVPDLTAKEDILIVKDYLRQHFSS